MRKFKEHPGVPDKPRRVIYDMYSVSRDENTLLPVALENVEVYVASACKMTFDGSEKGDGDLCYQIEFHAGILGGDFEQLRVLVTKVFQPPVSNPFNGVKLEYGMVLRLSGTLRAGPPHDDYTGVAGFFHLDASCIKREKYYSEVVRRKQERIALVNGDYVPNTRKLGEFTC